MQRNIGRVRMALVASFAYACAITQHDAHAQTIEFTRAPVQSVTGVPRIRLRGFPPDAEVTVRFVRTPPDGLPPAYSAGATFRTGPDGSVHLASIPLRGDWKLPVPEAPFWSMQPDAKAPLPAPGVVLIQAESKSVQKEAEYLLPRKAALVIEDIAAFTGAFLVRPAESREPLPLIIVLGGSDGDDATARQVAPRLAAEGFAALGLPYVSPDRGRGQAFPGLPSSFSEIPVDRIDAVRRWAATDPRVDARRIGLWGQSKGAEFALIAAAHFPWLDAVAAIVPSDVVWEGFGYGALARTGTSSFSMGGRPLPFAPYGGSGRTRTEKQAGRWRHPERASSARIPIDRFQGHLLVAGGEQDPVWDSGGMSQSIAERRAESGRATTLLVFEDAGHALAGDPLVPVDSDRGGTVEGNGRARLAIWAATRELFRAAWNLGEDPR